MSLAGHLATASRDFAAADALWRKNDSHNDALYSIWGIHWTRHRLRLSEADAARRLTSANRAFCNENSANADLARCDLLLGELDLHARNHAAAAPRIAAVVRVFREAKMGQDLPDALLAMARVRRAAALAERVSAVPATSAAQTATAFTGDESALSHCEEALRLAARSGFRLKQCDALNLRAQLLREAGRPAAALADAQAAHDLALQCDYYWGRHEALRQLCDTHYALGPTHAAEARQWDEAECALTQKMAPEFAAALEINRQHDAEMERLYGQKPPKK